MDYTDTIGFIISLQDGERREELIALLSEYEFLGMEENDDELRFYLPPLNTAMAGVRSLLQERELTFYEVVLPYENWNEAWERTISPVEVTDQLRIRASFHNPDQRFPLDLVITPKMSFGSGHHPTTLICMKLMLDADITGRSVLDFGAGTGILSILAEKLGASFVDAVENDGWSIENLRENIEVNDCKVVTAFQQAYPPAEKKYNLIVANLNRHILLEHMHEINQALSNNAVLILSGILTSDVSEFKQMLHSLKLSVIKIEENSSWAGILAIFI